MPSGRGILPFLAAAVTLSGQGAWELVGEGYQLTGDSAVDTDGNVFISDARRDRILKIDPAGKISVWKEPSNHTHGVAWGPDGRLYGGQHDLKRMVAFSADGAETVITEGVQSHHLKVSRRNELYFSVPPAKQLWLFDAKGQRRIVFEGLTWPRAIAISPDGSKLALNEPSSLMIWQFEIDQDGSLRNGRPFCRLEGKDLDAGGMTFDSDGSLYVATKRGIQVCDRSGRVVSVIEVPGTEGANDVLFAGPGLKWMYVTQWDRIYRRPVQPKDIR